MYLARQEFRKFLGDDGVLIAQPAELKKLSTSTGAKHDEWEQRSLESAFHGCPSTPVQRVYVFSSSFLSSFSSLPSGILVCLIEWSRSAAPFADRSTKLKVLVLDHPSQWNTWCNASMLRSADVVLVTSRELACTAALREAAHRNAGRIET